MPKFNIYGHWTRTKLLGQVEADNRAKALAKAAKAGLTDTVLQLCHQCEEEAEQDDITPSSVTAYEQGEDYPVDAKDGE